MLFVPKTHISYVVPKRIFLEIFYHIFQYKFQVLSFAPESDSLLSTTIKMDLSPVNSLSKSRFA